MTSEARHFRQVLGRFADQEAQRPNAANRISYEAATNLVYGELGEALVDLLLKGHTRFEVGHDDLSSGPRLRSFDEAPHGSGDNREG